MILSFKDYRSIDNIDFDGLGQINEGHRYSGDVCSVMDKITAYVKRSYHLENSSLNESAKRIYDRDIRFSREERIAVSCIFNEMLKQYEATVRNEIELCENIINKGSLLEEGVEYDYDTLVSMFSINEGIGDWLKKKYTDGKAAVIDTAKKMIDGAKEVVSKSADVVKAKSSDLVDWAKQAKKDFEERYENLKKVISNIVKKGIDGVREFINNLLEIFTSIGDNLVDAVKKLGGLKMDKGERPAKLDNIETDDLYKNASSPEEKSFINNIIIRVETMLEKDKDNVAKLMTESYSGIINESIVDNKFIAWLSGYKNGEKMSWWKSILIGLCASLIVWMLPKVLAFAGVGVALTMFITALVGVTWNGIGLLKLIYRRNKERKEGEKFFDKKTAIFFTLCILSTVFSLATFAKTIAPLLREICNSMGWTGGDDMGKFGEFIYNITKKISPANCFQEGGLKEVSEEIQNFGGDFRGNDIIQANKDAVNAMKEMPGATTENVKAYEDFLAALQNSKGSSGVLKAAQEFKDNADLPTTFMLDTSKWGGSGPIRQAIKELQDAGSIPDSTILTTGGSLATQKASKGVFGFCTFLTGLSNDQANEVLQKAAEIAGKDASTIQIHSFGGGTIADVLTHTETIQGAFDVLAPNATFLPLVMPFFDKKKWGKYKMRFASSTRGAAAYTVNSVEMLPVDKIDGDSQAFDILKKLHNDTWSEYQKLDDDKSVNESLFKKKDKKKETVEEPQYVVFYVDSTDTGNDNDRPEGKEDNKKSTGVVIDTLTMMAADVCDFGESAKIRRRPQPYFMKGLLSRLSFRPIENNDNETKEYIRETLGQTMKTLLLQNVLYGTGKKYIDSKIDGKKAEYSIRETILGSKTKVDADKKLFELGNFTPNEILECLTDKSDTNKIAYDYLDGKYASKVSVKMNDEGNIVSKRSTADTSTIENMKYYRVSRKAYNEIMDTYKENLDKYKNKKLDKKPSKPSFIKGDDGNYYKRASKKFRMEHKSRKYYDFVDLRIVPVLKKGELYKKLIEDKNIKKLLYKEDDKNNVKLNKNVIDVLRPFLYRPEKTFAKADEYQLAELLKEQGVEGEKLGWFKNLFKDEEQLHDTFKEMIEMIWDYLSDNVRTIYKDKDLKSNHKTNEDYESLFDELIEEFDNQDYDETNDYQYDLIALNDEYGLVLSREDFLNERYG